MCKIVAITNNKGGVGKTTTTLNLGCGLVKKGFRVLLIDTDPQANLSSSFGLDDRSDFNLGNYLIGNKTWKEIVQTISMKDGGSIDVAPAARQMEDLANELDRAKAREKLLKKMIQKEGIREQYDFVLIDCGPNLGLMTTNALCCADSYIIPFQAEYFSYTGTATILEFTEIFMEDEDLNPGLEFGGIVITRYHDKIPNKALQALVSELRQSDIKDKIFNTYIRTNSKLMESPMNGQCIFDFDEKCNGSQDYMNLVNEFLDRQKQLA